MEPDCDPSHIVGSTELIFSGWFAAFDGEAASVVFDVSTTPSLVAVLDLENRLWTASVAAMSSSAPSSAPASPLLAFSAVKTRKIFFYYWSIKFAWSLVLVHIRTWLTSAPSSLHHVIDFYTLCCNH